MCLAPAGQILCPIFIYNIKEVGELISVESLCRGAVSGVSSIIVMGELRSWGLYISFHTWTRGKSCHSHESEALTSLTWTHMVVYSLPKILSILFLPIQFSNWNSRDLIGLFIQPSLNFEQTTGFDSDLIFIVTLFQNNDKNS